MLIKGVESPQAEKDTGVVSPLYSLLLNPTLWTHMWITHMVFDNLPATGGRDIGPSQKEGDYSKHWNPFSPLWLHLWRHPNVMIHVTPFFFSTDWFLRVSECISEIDLIHGLLHIYDLVLDVIDLTKGKYPWLSFPPLDWTALFSAIVGEDLRRPKMHMALDTSLLLRSWDIW